MKIKMELLSDAIFGNGISVPGGEDISVLCDENGFPYYKGGTFKGVFREMMERYMGWTGQEESGKLDMLLGKSGDNFHFPQNKLIFSDFCLSDYVKQQILSEFKDGGTAGSDAGGEEAALAERREQVLNALSHTRTFTAVKENGTADEGTLRSCRCVNKGLFFYSQVEGVGEDQELAEEIEEILSCIKWIGTMRNRGFGKVKITVDREGGK